MRLTAKQASLRLRSFFLHSALLIDLAIFRLPFYWIIASNLQPKDGSFVFPGAGGLPIWLEQLALFGDGRFCLCQRCVQNLRGRGDCHWAAGVLVHDFARLPSDSHLQIQLVQVLAIPV